MEFNSSKKRPRRDNNVSSEATASPSPTREPPLGKRLRATAFGLSPANPFIVIHRIECTREGTYHQKHEPAADYLDVPRLLAGANRKTGLHGQRRLNVDSYLEDHSGLSFVVYITYSCTKYHDEVKESFKRLPMPAMDSAVAQQAKPYFYILEQDSHPARAESEALILSAGLEEALSILSSGSSSGLLRDWNAPSSLRHPYLQFYHSRHLLIDPCTEALETAHQNHLKALGSFLQEHLSQEFAEANALFKQGRVTREHWTKLFRPDEVVVTMENGHQVGLVSLSCPVLKDNHLSLHCWSWSFEGTFFRREVELTIPWPSKSEPIDITDLDVYPLKYAKGGLEDTLRSRGERFWACRDRRYVSYEVPLQGMEVQIANLRYMVDAVTYKVMYPEEEVAPERTELSVEETRNDTIPQEPFALLLPATIRGYGFHNKKWRMLSVEHIRDIKWNDDVFDHRLVLEEDKKQLIKALITVHIGKNNTTGIDSTEGKGSFIKTDFMEGKGEGLIILLHGAPGTGKTLTAESIAEHAKCPLYRVTCGDIGTDPEAVEKYLDSVLFIGSTWGCVVLLDEADVFLEERTKMDLQRNALVSVFLRVLEYYDGILILTTNRIGTFDEAFKSRVQLALHYPKLNEDGRHEVWYNFIESLRDGGEDINFDQIIKKLPVLARHSLNGRQIRNTINTARQLARYKRETLGYPHIEKAVRVVDEFEQHIKDVHGHDDEEYAREKGER